MNVPKDIIPAPEMTVKEYQAWYRRVERHPNILTVKVQFNCQPGDVIVCQFTQWNKTYTILIIEDGEETNWGEFDSLRVDWEKDAKISA